MKINHVWYFFCLLQNYIGRWWSDDILKYETQTLILNTLLSVCVWIFGFSCHCVWERERKKKPKIPFSINPTKYTSACHGPDFTDTRKLVTVIGIPFTLYMCAYVGFYCSVCDKMHIEFKPAFFPLIHYSIQPQF